MNVISEIDDADLDDLEPDEGDDEPVVAIHAAVRMADGKGHCAMVHLPAGTEEVATLAEALVSALHGAARIHSPALATALERWLVVPDGLEVE